MLQFMYMGACKVPHLDLVPMMKLSFRFGVHALKELCALKLFEIEVLTSMSAVNDKDVAFLLDIQTMFYHVES